MLCPADRWKANLLCKRMIMRQSEFQIISGTLPGQMSNTGPTGAGHDNMPLNTECVVVCVCVEYTYIYHSVVHRGFHCSIYEMWSLLLNAYVKFDQISFTWA